MAWAATAIAPRQGLVSRRDHDVVLQRVAAMVNARLVGRFPLGRGGGGRARRYQRDTSDEFVDVILYRMFVAKADGSLYVKIAP
jgi:hypothetical protein